MIFDNSLSLTEIPEQTRRSFYLSTQSTQKSKIAAIVPGIDAVADVSHVYPIVNYSSILGTGLKVLDTLSDGTQLVEFTIALGGELPEDFSILIEAYSSGVIFDDGTIERTVTADDLDDLGRYRYRMSIPPDVPGSACNFYQLMQGSEPISYSM